MSVDKLQGFACLSYIARRTGIDISVGELDRRYGHFQESTSPSTLISIAREMGLEAKTATEKPASLSRFRRILPALLVMADGSLAILQEVLNSGSTGQSLRLISPSTEENGVDATVLVNERQLGAVWNGSIILFKPTKNTQVEGKKFDLNWILAQAYQERSIFRDVAIASFFSTAFALAPPFITMIIIDRVIVNRSTSTLYIIIGTVALLIIFQMILGFVRRVLVQITATRIDGRLSLHVLDRVLKLPMEYFEKTPTGLTLGRLSQLSRIRGFMTGQLFGTFLDMITLIGLVPALIILSWKLSILVLGCALSIFLIVYVYLKPLAAAHAQVVEAESAKNSFLAETLYGMRAVKSLVLEDRRRSEWDARVAKALSASYDWRALSNYPETFAIPFERLMFTGSIILGAAIALSSPTSVAPGALLAFSMLAGRTAQPLIQLARLMSDIGELRGAVSEVAKVMNEPQEDLRAGIGVKLPVRGNINFSSVNFRYSPGATLALSNVTFEIRPGAIFGIMGRSGSGKTTITRLLQGLSPTYDGIIKIDGMDLREMDLHHLRLNVGVVPQENFLFSGTIRENISIARPRAGMHEVIKAAQLAGAEEFIERLPRGYETRLEEGASNLSGGQRQRLALARALIIDPPVLILDEATSALDAESEAIINANLARIAQDRTVICVSHRLSMLVPASAILVMERGSLYDLGTHDQLLSRCDIYSQMWFQQNKHVTPNGHQPYPAVSQLQS